MDAERHREGAKMEEKERQVMEFAACDRATAANLLQQYNGDSEQAIMALIARPSLAKQVEQQGSTPYQESNAHKNDNQWPPNEVTFSEDKGQWSNHDNLYHSSHNTNSRSSPIDLTEDDDEDLRKAMQASLESENNRQKRQQEYGPSKEDTGNNMNEEEQLTRAIEASMLQSSVLTRPQSPSMLQTHLEKLDTDKLRSPEQPMALLAPSPSVQIFALALQAIYAAEPLRRSLLSLRFDDIRTRSFNEGDEDVGMKDYWRGASPTGLTVPPAELWQNLGINEEVWKQVDPIMRIDTLLAFMMFSKRPICVAEDVIAHDTVKNNYAYIMNSEQKNAGDILACYIEYVLGVFSDLLSNQEISRALPSPAEAMSDAFVSHVAVAAPSDQQENTQPVQAKETYEHTLYHLQHSIVNTTVHRALYACLADDKALFHKLGKTLFFSVRGPSSVVDRMYLNDEKDSTQDIPPFRIETRLYLDAFTFSERKGVRLGLNSSIVEREHARITELEKYKKSITNHQGDDTRTLLQDSINYFSQQCTVEGNDTIRADSVKEAVPRLTHILTQLDKEIEQVEVQLSQAREKVKEERNSTLGAFEKDLSKPEFQKLQYDLQVVIMTHGESIWMYVRHGDESRESDTTYKWWRIHDGQVEMVQEQQVLEDQGQPCFLIYTSNDTQSQDLKRSVSVSSVDEMDRNDKPAKTIRIDSERNWWSSTILVDAIERDNAEFARHLAKEIRLHESESISSEKAPNLDTPVS